jgi:N-acetylglucosamine-6-phosphate deacetylase
LSDDFVVAGGLIDLQINGGYGFDFTSDPDSIWQVARLLPQQGVTAFLPTIITSTAETVSKALMVLENRPSDFSGSEPLGLHLEGPMLSSLRAGVHESELMRTPSLDLIEDWHSGVSMVTLAPELAGAEAVVRALGARHVVVSAGHSAATYDEARQGFEWGIKAVTHLFNGMEPFTHRAPGLIGATFDSDAVAGLICDGIHIHPAVVKTAYRLLGPERLALVTDAMAATGLGDGEFRLGERLVSVHGGKASVEDGRLAGSTLTLDQAVRNLRAFADCSPAAALAAASTVPSKLLGLAVRSGDAAVFDRNLEVISTSVGGQIVWER